MNKQSVTVKAVVQRINRKLASNESDLALRHSRGMQQQQDVGEYWLHDFNRNFVVEKDVCPETLARELGVLSEYEGCA